MSISEKISTRTSMKKSIFNAALQIAKSKLHKHPQVDCYPHYCFIVQDNRIIEWATNSSHIPPKHYGYHRTDDPTFVPKLHAEVFAYKRAKGLLNHDDPFEIINMRFTKNGLMRLSKPCKSCFHLMKVFGCKKFYYSSEVGFLSI